MSKLVIVIDGTPGDCANCGLCDECDERRGMARCGIGGEYRFKRYWDWDCPLFTLPIQELPKLKENGEVVGYKVGELLTEQKADDLMAFGFNECLHEILGGGCGE